MTERGCALPSIARGDFNYDGVQRLSCLPVETLSYCAEAEDGPSEPVEALAKSKGKGKRAAPADEEDFDPDEEGEPA